MRDNQPKHRQLAKERSKDERKAVQRQERGTALITFEGQCTEPQYFKGLLRELRISSSVEIFEGNGKSDALSVVERARARFDLDPRDRVFAVIDAEQENLAEALESCKEPVQQANRRKGLPEIRIEPIVTAPCFEFWLLLHFDYTDRAFTCFSDLAPAIESKIPGYHKSDPLIFRKAGGVEGVLHALEYVQRLKRRLSESGASIPNSDIPLLIQALCDLSPVKAGEMTTQDVLRSSALPTARSRS